MKYKVGDQVLVRVANQKSGYVKVVICEPLKDSKITEKAFTIVYVNPRDETYMINIDDNMLGWYISEWHVKFYYVDKKYLGTKFVDITESMIIKKKL